MSKIIVASKNPVKVQATQDAFERFFNKPFEAEGISIPSNVPDQPIGDEETYTGALNRATGAKQTRPDADFWIGIEGGITTTRGEMETFAWMVVLGKDGQGHARTAGFFLPPRVAELVNQGYELGDADDIVFGASNSKQKTGALGLLTKDVLTRHELYLPAIMMALIPFRNPELYFSV
jgi:inosine/xanthosine triphosphatase